MLLWNLGGQSSPSLCGQILLTEWVGAVERGHLTLAEGQSGSQGLDTQSLFSSPDTSLAGWMVRQHHDAAQHGSQMLWYESVNCGHL